GPFLLRKQCDSQAAVGCCQIGCCLEDCAEVCLSLDKLFLLSERGSKIDACCRIVGTYLQGAAIMRNRVLQPASRREDVSHAGVCLHRIRIDSKSCLIV